MQLFMSRFAVDVWRAKDRLRRPRNKSEHFGHTMGRGPLLNDREIVAYCRVSTQEQGMNGLGMAAQRAAVSRFAAAFSCIIVAFYEEVETGRKDRLDNRPQIIKAVAHAKRSGALLVIARIDRLARSVLVTSQLLESGVEFVACDNPHANRLTIHILAAMAEHEGRLISERTKAGLAAARERGVMFGNGGRYLTAEARYKGQQAAKLAHVRRAREAYADLAPLMRELREGKSSMRDIAAHLNDMGHRNQRRHRWSISNVRALHSRRHGAFNEYSRLAKQYYAGYSANGRGGFGNPAARRRKGRVRGHHAAGR